jgi:hypothetical protein
MIGRQRGALGIALLGALIVCAWAASSASATSAVNTTAFTCVKVESGAGFSDEHCEKSVGSKAQFAHEQISLDETRSIDVTNQKVTEETKKSEPAIFITKSGLTKVETECTEVKANPSQATVHNVEVESKHKFTGTATIEFSKCTVKQPSKCTIKEPIVGSATFEGVEGLEGPKEEANAMGVEFRGSGAEETFAETTFTGAECSLKEKTSKIKGSLIGTSGPTTESAQNNKSSGATIVLTPKNSMQKLKFGVEAAELTLIITPFGSGGPGGPISVTTST